MSAAPAGAQAAPGAAAATTFVAGASLPPPVSRIVAAAERLFAARTMQEHEDAMALLDRNIHWEAPIISLEGREAMRCCVYIAKSIAFLQLQPSVVAVYPAGFDRTIVEVQGTVLMALKRTLLVPFSLLLPEFPIRATIKLGVRGPLESGTIELLNGQWHNLPALPAPIRALNGFLMGHLMHLSEPAWAPLLHYVGDDYWKARQAEMDRGPTAGAPAAVAGARAVKKFE